MHPHRLHIRSARNYAPPSSRNRVLYALLALVVNASGLLWRSGLIPLPPSLSNYGGDALWALMVFLGIGFLLPKSSTGKIALLALAFAWGVEFSQLYRAPWIDAIRATTPASWCWATPSLGLTCWPMSWGLRSERGQSGV